VYVGWNEIFFDWKIHSFNLNKYSIYQNQGLSHTNSIT